MNRLGLLVGVSLLLSGCGGSGGGGVPDCLVFTPVHATSGGVVDVGELFQGMSADDAIEVETTGIEGAPSGSLFVELATNCDDPDCTPDVECEPDTLDPVGQTVTCDVVDNIAGDVCSWSCQVSLTATVLDDDVCHDVFVVVDVVGSHGPDAMGR